MSSGIPKRDIQCLIRAWAHVLALESERGMAFGYRVKRLMIVKRYRIPLLGDNGPTRSIYRLLKQPDNGSL